MSNFVKMERSTFDAWTKEQNEMSLEIESLNRKLNKAQAEVAELKRMRPTMGDIKMLETENAKLRELLKRSMDLSKEVYQWHSDEKSSEFNGCEQSPCLHCEMGHAIIAEYNQLTNKTNE